MCYLCGRKFGTRSLGIHLRSCRGRWERVRGVRLSINTSTASSSTSTGTDLVLHRGHESDTKYGKGGTGGKVNDAGGETLGGEGVDREGGAISDVFVMGSPEVGVLAELEGLLDQLKAIDELDSDTSGPALKRDVIRRYNRLAVDAYMNVFGRVACVNCGRRFEVGRLEVHL
ncbi:hypothetical protein HK102_011925, partial [Quaeritorhiza haematococci]